MADNLSPAPAPRFALADHAVIALEGPEAVAFAHAQFANDVIGLATGHWQWNAWLTPKGRVIALFALARLADDRLLLIVPDHPVDTLATALRRFVFRRKVQVRVADDLHVSAAFAAPVDARGARIGILGTDVELDLGGDGGSRTLWVSDSAALVDSGREHAWMTYDVQHGVPRLPEAQREQWTPQQLSLDRLQAFSVKKGCYPGQEIVARTHFLGKAKRALSLLVSATALPADARVDDGTRDIGDVVCVVDRPTPLALAVLPLERDASASLSVGGTAVHEQPLLGGLAR